MVKDISAKLERKEVRNACGMKLPSSLIQAWNWHHPSIDRVKLFNTVCLARYFC